MMEPHSFIVALVACALVSQPPKLPRPTSRSFPPVFPSRSFGVSGCMFSLYPFQVHFHEWCQTVVRFHSFECDCPVLPTPFIEVTVLSPLHILGSSVVNELTTYAWVYFWAPDSGPLTCGCFLWFFLPAPCCFFFFFF